ncbi:MAG TPA: 2-hydroxymuconate tautomerase family protein [Dongiaceae bacterium]|jgi:4-oxalocrotonate tautomerase|nr:2-hydroxymuconate tautomerase family protein [Dongiaceae bacterium]
MPLIEVTIVEGRTREQKLALMARVTDAAIETLGVSPQAVRVCIREIPFEHWGVAGKPMDRR